jgi:hypothetical protein
MSIPNFIKIHPAVLELNHVEAQTDGQTWSALYAFISCKECITTMKRMMDKCSGSDFVLEDDH